MAVGERTGKCVNIGNCSRADKQEEIVTKPGTDFVCPECGKSLIALTNAPTGGRQRRGPLLLVAAVVVVAMLGLVFMMRGGEDRLDGNPAEQNAATSPTVTSPGTPKSGASESAPDPSSTTIGVLARIRESGVLRVGMEPDAAPLHFVNERKQDDGFDFRLAGIVADAIGVERVQVVEADYEDLPGRLTTGEVDIVMAGYVPDPSIADVDWSIGYLEFGLCMIVHERNAATLRTPSDLAGKRIAIYDDPAAERWVTENIPGARITQFSGDAGWFEAVEQGQADALIYDYPFAAEEIKSHPRTTIVRYNLNQSKYAAAVRRGNHELLNAINNVIDQFRSTPQYAELMREYLTASSAVFMQPIPGKRTYTVKPGDSLSKIAAARLGDSERWPEIWELNRDRVADENLIYPKLVLLMP